MLAVGAATLIWQVAAARSVMAGLYGDELTLGLVLASWLLLVGGATALSARLLAGHGARERARRLLPAALMLCPVAVLASALLRFGALPAMVGVGAVVSPASALAGALLCLAPPCALLGAAFGLLSHHAPADERPERWAARVYLWESLGTGAAGVAFHLLLAPLPLPALGIAASVSPWLAGLALARRASGNRAVMVICGLAGVAALALLIPLEASPTRELLRPRTPGYQLRAAENSRHGALAVLARGDQLVFSSNGIPLFSNQDQPLVRGEIHATLLCHRAPARVLLVGGGLGGGLAEVLRHPVRRVDYVELDPALVALARRLGTGGQRRALADRRVRVLDRDGRAVVASAGGRYDVIMVGLPGPSSALINRFYTEEFFRAARRALRPGGLLRVTLTGSESYLGDQQALLHATVGAAMVGAFANMVALPGQATLLLAGRDGAPAVDEPTLARRLERRGLAAAGFGPGELMDLADPLARELYGERLAGVAPLRNTDLHPAAYFQAMIQGVALTSPALAAVLSRAGVAAGRWGPWAAALAAMFAAGLLGLLLRRGRRRGGGAGAAVALAGFCGMAVELSLILYCQEQRGVIYHEVGALLTAFMAGLAAGAPAGARLVSRWPGRALGIGLALCAAAALACAGLMLLLPAGAVLPLWAGALCLACLGLGVGSCYAPAAAALARTRDSGAAAAYSYAWDLGGAAAGALLAATFILPALGLPGTCLLCAGLCAGYGATTWSSGVTVDR